MGAQGFQLLCPQTLELTTHPRPSAGLYCLNILGHNSIILTLIISLVFKTFDLFLFTLGFINCPTLKALFSLSLYLYCLTMV